MNQKITLISNEKCWMEQSALTQLEALASLPGAVRAVGLPDLHAGRTPVGAVVETEGILYPHLIGNDIGCGMGLFACGVPLRKVRQERFVSRLSHIRALGDLPIENPFPEESPISDLGTIGGGNHFIEFQAVEEVRMPGELESIGIGRGELLLLVHCGSRGYGQRIFSGFLDYGGLPAGGGRAAAYLAAHGDALLWAKRNRFLAAQKLAGWLGFGSALRPALDCAHNFLEEQDGRFVHRKGAVSAERGLVVLPGSRGSLTYLLKPAADTALSAHSLSHGAGRKWARSLCRSRLRNKYDRDSIRETALKSRVVCHDTGLLYQEAPEAYKNVEQVVAALEEHRLAEVAATPRPLITYKG